jgi:hypothetical protein
MVVVETPKRVKGGKHGVMASCRFCDRSVLSERSDVS